MADDPINNVMLSLDERQRERQPPRGRLLPLAGRGLLATVDEADCPVLSEVVTFYDGVSYYFRLASDAPEVERLRRRSRLSMYLVDPITDHGHVLLRGHAEQFRIQRSYGLVYIRIALDGDPVRLDG